MSFLHEIKLDDPDKLAILRRLDQFRAWHSLDERRFCLACREIVTGRDIHVIGGTRATGPMRLVCPTKLCPAIPMDWVLPTQEILCRDPSAPGKMATSFYCEM